MKAYQQEFIEFAIRQGVLKFGEFTLKSGRISPYFFNAGLFNSGLALARLGRFYAAALEDSGLQYDVVFGPAYKGIPLAATMTVALANDYQKDVPYVFNRNFTCYSNNIPSSSKSECLIIFQCLSGASC